MNFSESNARQFSLKYYNSGEIENETAAVEIRPSGSFFAGAMAREMVKAFMSEVLASCHL